MLTLEMNRNYSPIEIIRNFPGLRLLRVYSQRATFINIAIYFDPASTKYFQRILDERAFVERMQWIPDDMVQDYLVGLEKNFPLFVDLDEPASSDPIMEREFRSFQGKT